ncbi:hypothetical protein DM01DRAFT_302358 [Hesseltinella vesiculosa]|uniref:Uncharacterized protein n=1 Tax=Hesseltinella vesiculosa TaxID=101127 RepID=A0A1X2GEB1_9FUNG|nr:hypothetical protein DM01DRAFT_302358 [Hesseltinella vesiculosa]
MTRHERLYKKSCTVISFGPICKARLDGQLSHKATEQVSEIKERRQLYAKLQKCWPDNWMTTYELSRQYSAYKARLKNSEQWAAAAVSASSSSPAANAKKPANAGVKRTASSSSISSGTKPPNKHTSNSSPVMEKKLKLAHEASSPSPIVIPSDDESTTLRATGDGNIPVSSAPAPGPSSAVPTIGNAKPASMNIASLISGS